MCVFVCVCVLRGLGMGAERKIVQKRYFSWPTPQQYNFESAKFVRHFVVIA